MPWFIECSLVHRPTAPLITFSSQTREVFPAQTTPEVYLVVSILVRIIDGKTQTVFAKIALLTCLDPYLEKYRSSF